MAAISGLDCFAGYVLDYEDIRFTTLKLVLSFFMLFDVNKLA